MRSADDAGAAPAELDLRLGLDVGGTNTDAVVLDRDDNLVAKAKVPTTPDVTQGIAAAIEAVLARATADPARITHAMLGTTHATNAILQRRRLRRVAVLRLGAPATHAVRPLFGWP
jgi:N-methylhydantoinase A/oxoprolinase/acetone carboxylase beta subunit